MKSFWLMSACGRNPDFMQPRKISVMCNENSFDYSSFVIEMEQACVGLGKADFMRVCFQHGDEGK